MLPKATCKDCTNRSTACHDTCQQYIAWKAEQQALQRRIKYEQELIPGFGRKRGGLFVN